MLGRNRKAGVGLLTAKVEIGLAGMADWPFADAIVEIEQRGLAGDFGVGWPDQPARRSGGIGAC